MSDDASDDIGFDAAGQPIAIGKDARVEQENILAHPDAKPILVIAELNGDIGVRVYGPPDLKLADVLDAVARQYRQVVLAALKPKH